MLESFFYLILILIFTCGPILYVWYKYHKFFMKFKLIFILVLVIAPIIGYVWDYLAVKDGIWLFKNITGIWIAGLPLEEWLFFFLFPLFVTSVTLAFVRHDKK